MLSVPSPGEVVKVRRNRFLVTDVEKSTFGSDENLPGREQHRVSLQSVDDRNTDQRLEVIWEVEPGARLCEEGALPAVDRFDDPTQLGAFLRAVRWAAIQSADSNDLQSPFRSGIQIEDFQLEPLVRALKMPRVNLLIADDVGLGKTIEAGLVAQELLLRHRARTVLVICPASLQIKWQDEMREKFGLDFQIVNAASLSELRRTRGVHVNPWKQAPLLITSIDYLKSDLPMGRFRACLPGPRESIYPRRFDLMILDEAHNAAPAGSGRYALDSQRTQAIRDLAPHFEHKLFLSATPHNGNDTSFSALLELLDDRRFRRNVRPNEQQKQAVLVHRLKEDIRNEDGTSRFPPRVVRYIEVEHPEEEIQAHAELRAYADLRRAQAKESGAGFATEFVLKLLKKRLFSSPAAFATTLAKHEHTMQKKHAGAVSDRALGQSFDDLEEDFFDDDLADEAETLALENAASRSDALSAPASESLKRLQAWAARGDALPDAKAQALFAWIREVCLDGDAWNRERVIIFTEYRATQKWLQAQFAQQGLAGDGRLEVLYGGMDGLEREKIKAAFQTDPNEAPVRVLLATDSASEGIDLQNHCHRLVHYEIPWNPNRLEQRNGRVDRHGQTASEVSILHFVSKGWQEIDKDDGHDALAGDLEFLMRVVDKVEQIRRDLGKVGPVIADQLSDRMLGKRRDLDTASAERAAAPAREMLRTKRKIHEQVAEAATQLHESAERLEVSADNVREVVELGLALAEKPGLIGAELPGVWPDPRGKRTETPVFCLPELSGGTWSRCSEGLRHPHTGRVRPITFDRDVAQDRDDVVHIHLGHKLVAMCQRYLREEMSGHRSGSSIHRVTTRVVADTELSDIAVLAHARLLVLGGTHQRLHEELLVAGGLLEDGKWNALGVGKVEQLLAAASDVRATPLCEKQLVQAWPQHASSLEKAIQRRGRDRAKSLKRLLQEQASDAIKKMKKIQEELAQAIRRSLAAEPPVQRELFSSEEQEQFKLDRAGLERGLEEIPGRIVAESEQIQRRYADPDPRVFPIAITFLVPESLNR